jgi:hypothetical protein
MDVSSSKRQGARSVEASSLRCLSDPASPSRRERAGRRTPKGRRVGRTGADFELRPGPQPDGDVSDLSLRHHSSSPPSASQDDDPRRPRPPGHSRLHDRPCPRRKRRALDMGSDAPLQAYHLSLLNLAPVRTLRFLLLAGRQAHQGRLGQPVRQPDRRR